MTAFLSIVVGAAIALAIICGVLFSSMWIADRRGGAGMSSWKDSGSGNVDGYGTGQKSSFADFSGGDAGGGGGD